MVGWPFLPAVAGYRVAGSCAGPRPRPACSGMQQAMEAVREPTVVPAPRPVSSSRKGRDMDRDDRRPTPEHASDDDPIPEVFPDQDPQVDREWESGQGRPDGRQSTIQLSNADPAQPGVVGHHRENRDTSGQGLAHRGQATTLVGATAPRGAISPDTSPSRWLTDADCPCRHRGTHEYQSGLLGTGPGGISGAR
jgi:hypothetical protein